MKELEQLKEVNGKMPQLPRCKHGYALSDWGGNWLVPPCGCNFDNTTDTNKDKMAFLKLR